MSAKETIIAISDIISGSEDNFRNALGGYYTVQDIEGLSYMNFTGSVLEDPVDQNIDAVFYEQDQTVMNTGSSIVPSYTVPIRIAAMSENFDSDEHWAAYVTGRTYGDETYSPIVREAAYEYTNLSFDLPYTNLEYNQLDREDISYVIEIGNKYLQYLEQYQQKIQQFSSEFMIPNFYTIADMYRYVSSDDITGLYHPELIQAVSLEGDYPTPQNLFDFNDEFAPDVTTEQIESFDKVRQQNTNLTISYLNNAIFRELLNEPTIEWATSKQKAMLFDNKAITAFEAQSPLGLCLPFNTQINFNNVQSKDFVVNYIDSGFDSRLLAGLHNIFTTDAEIAPTTKTYNRNSSYYGSGGDVKETTTVEYREIDYMEFLAYCRNNYINDNQDMMFAGTNDVFNIAALDDTGMYRQTNIVSSTNAIMFALSFLQNVKDSNITNWDSFYGDQKGYNEIIAYRIEKFVGEVSSDSFTNQPFQNFWFLNSSQKDIFEFIDNQVKLNKQYTYRVYSYVLASGIKYRYSNLLLTRDLACGYTDDKYGLEFYNPNISNYNRENRLFDGTNFSTDFDDSAGGTYGTEAQIDSKYKYLADFNLTYEPSLKIIEVPLYSKTLTVTDNPPNNLVVTPYYYMNDSQTVVFDFGYGTDSKTPVPTPISNTDESMREIMLFNNDKTGTDAIMDPSVSMPQTIEIYRLSTKPTMMTDFAPYLIDTIDLRMKENSQKSDKFATYTNQINTNTKYYYAFRVLNQNGIPGPVTEIYETELINDGGYKFALFNTILEEEIEEKPMFEKSIGLKKIFQLQPNLDQVEFDTTNVDFTQPASTQIGNVNIGSSDDLVWNRTFKVRLTSKKTNKKIDLNITYKIGSE